MVYFTDGVVFVINTGALGRIVFDGAGQQHHPEGVREQLQEDTRTTKTAGFC